MTTPLRYQVATYDCGPTCLMNAFSYLFDSKNIPAIIIQTIWRYTLDCFNNEGKFGEGGTSRYAMQLFTAWLKDYSKTTYFPCDIYYLKKEEINYETLFKFMKENSVIIIRCFQSCDHYVLITDILDEYFYIFDPYYVDKDFVNKDDMVEFDWNHPFKYNRIVKRKRILSDSKDDFSLGPIFDRECIILIRN